MSLKYCRIPFTPIVDCFFWGVPIWPTSGFNASHWPLHSIRKPGFISIIPLPSPLDPRLGVMDTSQPKPQARLALLGSVAVQRCPGGKLQLLFETEDLGAVPSCPLLQLPILPQLHDALLLPRFKGGVPPDEPL